MSDATLPPPRSSSAALTAEVGHSSDSNSAEGEFDTSLDQSFDSGAKGEVSSGFEGRAENKQRRKRTRYVFDIDTLPQRPFCYMLFLHCMLH
jgi:hypothetical protein